ncbi:hypothetical protein GCM10017083_27510 [Thalassobaculum fulvum]|uniref:DUF1013 domain-containing protein n=1 Tax=Thalassobaculum fulvum TaxID=1633335 RepID=A0A918XSX4_9PROT|nr:cell cycle transcriptional regulator TrcR [Thalassobaculum fulvum]GHD52346.1 hypothetical protein GCM10017083_27510 [Thalassobaculum fulvum]
MAQPLMPKATAVWLIDNTALTFDQIAAFVGLHPLEVQAIADGEVSTGIQGFDPVLASQLTKAEIARCEADPKARLQMATSDLPKPVQKTKGPKYIPIAKRGDKPDAIAWLVKHHPELKDAQIARLIGTTKDTINKIRERTHWNSPNIQPRHPVFLGLCTQRDLDSAIETAGGTQVPPEEQLESISELP